MFLKKRCLSFRNLYNKHEIGHLTAPTLSSFHTPVFPAPHTHIGTLEISLFNLVPSKRGGRMAEGHSSQGGEKGYNQILRP